MPEEQYKPRKTLRTVNKTRTAEGILDCRSGCNKQYKPDTQEWFDCIERCRQKAREEFPA